eukprot:5436080-Amphidinium_carterae.1
MRPTIASRSEFFREVPPRGGCEPDHNRLILDGMSGLHATNSNADVKPANDSLTHRPKADTVVV